jgi:hypothetical protein
VHRPAWDIDPTNLVNEEKINGWKNASADNVCPSQRHHFLAVFYVNGGVSDLLFNSLSLYIFRFFLFISFTLFKDSLVTSHRGTDTEMGPSLAPSLL